MTDLFPLIKEEYGCTQEEPEHLQLLMHIPLQPWRFSTCQSPEEGGLETASLGNGRVLEIFPGCEKSDICFKCILI